ERHRLNTRTPRFAHSSGRVIYSLAETTSTSGISKDQLSLRSTTTNDLTLSLPLLVRPADRGFGRGTIALGFKHQQVRVVGDDAKQDGVEQALDVYPVVRVRRHGVWVPRICDVHLSAIRVVAV